MPTTKFIIYKILQIQHSVVLKYLGKNGCCKICRNFCRDVWVACAQFCCQNIKNITCNYKCHIYISLGANIPGYLQKMFLP